MEQDVLDQPLTRIRTRFELAAARLAEQFVNQGRVLMTREEMEIAREFLEHRGCKLEHLAAGQYRMTNRFGHTADLTREGAFLAALRQLAGRE